MLMGPSQAPLYPFPRNSIFLILKSSCESGTSESAFEEQCDSLKSGMQMRAAHLLHYGPKIQSIVHQKNKRVVVTGALGVKHLPSTKKSSGINTYLWRAGSLTFTGLLLKRQTTSIAVCPSPRNPGLGAGSVTTRESRRDC